MKTHINLLILLCWGSLLQAGVLNVTDFGAVGNNSTVNTAAIQAAIDSATINGDTVMLSSGTFVSGTLILKSNVTFFIANGATLKGSGSRSDYPDITPQFSSGADNYSLTSLLYAEGQDHITLTGGGTIDGNGSALTFLLDTDNRPFGMRFISCSNIIIENLSLKSSAFWMMHNLNIDTLTMRNLDIFNQANANNDGINVDGCREVYVGHCTVDSGDDPIVLKTMSLAITRNVEVEQCTVATYSRAIKIGTETNSGFENIHFHDIVVQQTSFTLPGLPASAKTGINMSIVDGGYIDSLLIENISMTAVQNPIFIRLGKRTQTFDPLVSLDSVGSIKHVVLRNIDAVADNNITSMVNGIPGHYIQDVLFENIDITIPGGSPAISSGYMVPENETGKPESDMFGDSIPSYGLYLRHVDGIKLVDVCITTQQPDNRPLLATDDIQNMEPYSVSTSGSESCFVLPTGIADNEIPKLKLYPNPTNGLLHLSEPASYHIYDLTGQMLANGHSDGTIDVSQLKTGLYLLRARTDDQSAVFRFTLQ